MTTKDFLTNHTFVKWVNHPDKETDTYWKNWMADNPEHLSQLKLARELLLRTRYKEFEPSTGAKQRILENILNSPAPAPVQYAKRRQSYTQFCGKIWHSAGQLTRIAAILLLSVSLGWLALSHNTTVVSAPNVAEESPRLQKSTDPGEKLQVILPDGTRVWLNSVSEISFPERFDASERVVLLSGEAFFEVEKDPLRPFRVVANETVTTALGTSFNIEAKRSDKVKVSLFTGKVKVRASSGAENLFLTPGQELRFDKQLGDIRIDAFNLREVSAWRDGRILFKDAALPEVVELLEDWYGVKIHLHNAEGVDWQYSGEYKNQTLDNVLNSLAYIQKFKYTIREKNVEFKF